MQSKGFPYTFLFFFTFCLSLCGLAQSSSFFYKNGNNLSQLNCGGVLFAPLTNQNRQAFGAGSVLVRKAINLQTDFSVSFVLDFTDTTGVDGGAFVFQSNPNSVGESFNGLGVKGVTQSVAITFDTKQNPQHNDPAFDHASIQSNGVIDHNATNNLAGPVSIEPLYKRTVFPPFGDVERKFVHVVTVSWKAAAKELSASADGVLLIKVVNDIVQTCFNGNPVVYWGFAASNTQEVWYPAGAELQFGYMSFSFGDIFPRMKTLPETDTCFGAPVQVFDASIYGNFNGLSGLNGAGWFWAFGDGFTSTLRNPAPHAFAAAGSYKIKLAVTNAFGCTFDTIVRTIQLGAKPVADFAYTAACLNTAIAFTDKSIVADGGIFGWEWKFGSLSTSNVQNPVAQFSTAGPQAVYLKARSNLGCESDTTKIVFVEEKPIVDASHTEDCFGNVQYKGFSLNNTAVKNWQWEFGDGRTSSLQNPLHHFNQNNNYKTLLWAVSNGGCVSDTVVQTVFIDVVKAFAGKDTVAVKGLPLQLNGSGAGKYRWSPTTGLNNAVIASPTATLFADQTYVLTVTNDKGCEDRDTIQIKVFDDADIYVPSAFTPNGDGKNDVFHWVAPGFKQLVYFRIYNRWGQLVFETLNAGGGWNGMHQNKPSPSGVYVWIAAGVDNNNRRQEKRGTVMLIR